MTKALKHDSVADWGQHAATMLLWWVRNTVVVVLFTCQMPYLSPIQQCQSTFNSLDWRFSPFVVSVAFARFYQYCCGSLSHDCAVKIVFFVLSYILWLQLDSLSSAQRVVHCFFSFKRTHTPHMHTHTPHTCTHTHTYLVFIEPTYYSRICQDPVENLLGFLQWVFPG